MRRLGFFFAFACLTLQVFAATPGSAAAAPVNSSASAAPPAQRSKWRGFDRIDFTWAGRPCVLVQPANAAPGKPWIWRTEMFDVDPQVDVALLSRGWHVAFIDVKGMYGSPRAMAAFNELYAHLVIHAGLSRRVVLEGFGPGAIAAFNFATAHPGSVAALYLDSPALDIRSWPGRDRKSAQWAGFLEAHGLTEASFAGFRGNPIERVNRAAAAKIPIIVVAGDADNVVPFAENTAALEKRYRELGGTIEVIVKPGAGHQPYSLPDPARVVEFLVKNARF